MSYEEYYSWLMEIGVGVFKFTPDQIKKMEIPDLIRGYEGHLKNLELQGVIERKKTRGGVSKDIKINSVEDFDKATERFG